MKKRTFEHSKLYIAIGAGGMIGAVSRYGLSMALSDTVPLATLIVNLVGCFFLTFLLNDPWIRTRFSFRTMAALNIGLIGSFTTFSTVLIETVELGEKSIVFAISYIVLSLFGGLLFCYGGLKLAKKRRVSE